MLTASCNKRNEAILSPNAIAAQVPACQITSGPLVKSPLPTRQALMLLELLLEQRVKIATKQL